MLAEFDTIRYQVNKITTESQLPVDTSSLAPESQSIQPEETKRTEQSDPTEIALSGSTLPVVLYRRRRHAGLVRGQPPSYTTYDNEVYDDVYDPDADAASGYKPQSWLKKPEKPEPTAKHSE